MNTAHVQFVSTECSNYHFLSSFFWTFGILLLFILRLNFHSVKVRPLFADCQIWNEKKRKCELVNIRSKVQRQYLPFAISSEKHKSKIKRLVTNKSQAWKSATNCKATETGHNFISVWKLWRKKIASLLLDGVTYLAIAKNKFYFTISYKNLLWISYSNFKYKKSIKIFVND